MYMALGYTCVADRSFKSADQLAEPSWLLITVNVWVFQPLLCVFCWVQAALEVFQQNQRWCQNFSVLPSGCGWAESDISPAAVSKRNQSDFAQSCDLTFVFFFSPPVQHTRLTCGTKVTYILDFFFYIYADESCWNGVPKSVFGSICPFAAAWAYHHVLFTFDRCLVTRAPFCVASEARVTLVSLHISSLASKIGFTLTIYVF